MIFSLRLRLAGLDLSIHRAFVSSSPFQVPSHFDDEREA
jgi:hypothetical protein